MEKKGVVWLIRLTLVLLIFLCIYIFIKLSPIWLPILHIIKIVLIPFLIAGFITYLLHPLIEGIHNRGVPRALAILSIYTLFFGGVGFGLYKLIPNIIAQLKDLAENIPTLIELYQSWIEKLYVQTSSLPEGFHAKLDEILQQTESFIEGQITHVLTLFKGIINYLILLGIIPFLAFYLLKDFDSLKRIAWYITPRRWREDGRQLLKDIDESLGGYIRGQLLVCLFVGILASIGFWIIDMRYPLLLGVIVGVTDIIPYFGPVLGALPAITIALTISFQKVLIVIGIIFIIQILESNLLSPLIVGKSLHMHPVFIIFSLLLGEELGGVIGLILAVPIMAVIKVTLVHVKVHLTKD